MGSSWAGITSVYPLFLAKPKLFLEPLEISRRFSEHSESGGVLYNSIQRKIRKKIYDKNVFACKLIAVFCPVGEEVKSIFMASGLPQQVLAHIW